MNKKKLVVVLSLLAALVTAWLIYNPPRRLGWCRYALTTYNGIPRLLSDLQIRADGAVRRVAKTHDLTMERISWLTTEKPDVLIVSIGWDGVVRPDEAVRVIKGCEVHILKNKEAIELFNRLKKAGKRVALHFHSTC